ncbi:MAG: hypothetical protein A2Z16_05995 [Chloroflexi bacterium RBG_16_54_18]|nr:MAG: hypothetical protein A2Z16_05995 [Chloroflexi bacterium RBG_16_54_18]
MFHELDMVKLLKSMPEKRLAAGAMGVILLVYDQPELPIAYEVEFTNDIDEVVLLTLFEDDLEIEIEW